MPLTVEARERAVARVLELEVEGASRAEACRRIAARSGVSRRQLARWLQDAESRTPDGEDSPALTAKPAPAGWAVVRAAAAGASALAVGADVVVKFPLTTTSVVALLLLPVWVLQLRRYRGAVPVVVLGVAAVLGGWALAALNTDHVVSAQLVQFTAGSVLSGVGAVGVLLWARTVLGTEVMALLAGLGMLVAVGVDGLSPLNAWKYQLSLPVTTIVLAVAARWRQPVLSAGALLALALVGVANDARSYAGFAVLTAAVVLWQALPARSPGRTATPWRRVQLAALLVMGVAGASSIGQGLLVGGALGAEVQARSQEQVAAGGGSLLVGGRPELQATLELVPAHPWGFGLGVLPNQEDVLLAKQGLASVGIQPGNGYVDNYMFGGRIELHSVLADLWASCGVVGALFGLTVLLVLLDALLAGAVARRASAQSVFWVASAVWFLGFGPIYTNMPDVAFALALVMAPAATVLRPRRSAGALQQRAHRARDLPAVPVG